MLQKDVLDRKNMNIKWTYVGFAMRDYHSGSTKRIAFRK
jgi:hypothetical protein